MRPTRAEAQPVRKRLNALSARRLTGRLQDTAGVPIGYIRTKKGTHINVPIARRTIPYIHTFPELRQPTGMRRPARTADTLYSPQRGTFTG